jgi:CubicO group peptidase (beta-lactamase class C family)
MMCRPTHRESIFHGLLLGRTMIRGANLLLPALLLSGLSVILRPGAVAAAGPFADGAFRGHIAWSCDGNHNDPDDWAASPVALAIFAEAGLKDRLVHFDYNCILPQTNPEWEQIHAESVLGTVDRYGYDRSRFHDCRKDLSRAVASIAQAINQATAEDPLYFIVAGPMEVPLLGIQQADPARRPYVYCISHSKWNDGYSVKYSYTNNKRDVIASGVNWVQIRDQNGLLSTSPYGRPATEDREWAPWLWMRNSQHPRVRWLWDRLQVSTRPDPSDAGMAYFLVSGDESADPEKLQRLLDQQQVPPPVAARQSIRLEAENAVVLEGLTVQDRSDRTVSHRLDLEKAGQGAARMQLVFRQPYASQRSTYDLVVRYFDEPGETCRFVLSRSGVEVGEGWTSAGQGSGWLSHTLADVPLTQGDTLELRISGGKTRLDYVQLDERAAEVSSSAAGRLNRPAPEPPSPSPPGSATASTPSSETRLDDPAALPGQIIVAGRQPGYLKLNGGRSIFLCGPDNPEEFLFLGELNPDGTRRDGGQEQMIQRLIDARVNAFHCQMFRMQRCNYKNEGDDQHCPFQNHDPSQPLSEAVLDQWDRWLSLFEAGGIYVHLEFYNDATDVDRIGWALGRDSRLHPDEHRWITGIVHRFKHHRNILWGIEESCNKLSRAHTPRFKKIGEAIAAADDHHHPIVQSFVVPNDPEGDFPPDGLTTDDYLDDPHIRVITWLHLTPHGDDFERQHREYLQFYQRDSGRFVVLKNETFHHPRERTASRRYVWSCAMTGTHTLEAYHNLLRVTDDVLADDGRLCQFMAETNFHRLAPSDGLAAADTHWVLADSGRQYVAYSYDCRGSLGLRQMPAGDYELKWFDTVSGEWALEQGVTVPGGQTTFAKPASLGNEVALLVTRRGPPASAGPLPAKSEPSATYCPPPESEGGWRSLVEANTRPSDAQRQRVRDVAGLDWDQLQAAWNYTQSFVGPSSLLVIRHGWVAGEWYNFTEPRGIASCTKSVTALAIGKLLELSAEGRVNKRITLDSPAWEFLPPSWAEQDANRKKILIRHLLTMTSGLDPYDGPYHELDRYRELILSLSPEGAPGTLWAYASAPVDLLSLIVEDVSGQSLVEFYQAHIAGPIGIAPFEWPQFGGHTNGSGGPGGGARLTPRELARLGYLLLHDGRWTGNGSSQQVLSVDTVRQWTRWSPQLELATYRDPNYARERQAQHVYGHLFWTNRNFQTLGRDVPEDTFYMSGWGKQACWIIPSLDLVVVRLGAHRDLNSRPEYYRELLSRVTAAVIR